MIETLHSRTARPPPKSGHQLNRGLVFVIGDLLPFFDIAGVLLSAWLASLISTGLSTESDFSFWNGDGRTALAAAVLTPLILCDRSFVMFASSGRLALLWRCYALRFLGLVVLVAATAIASHGSLLPSAGWFLLWLLLSLLINGGLRLLLISNLRRLERSGLLRETIAIIGGGPLTDRVVSKLTADRGCSIEIIGVFDDRLPRAGPPHLQPVVGTLDDLIELGKTRSLDWLLITLPGSAEPRLHSLIHRLKSLAVPIGLCPQGSDPSTLWRPSQRLGNGMAVTLLLEAPSSRWSAHRATAEAVFPRWVLTMLQLALWGLHKRVARPEASRALPPQHLASRPMPSIPLQLLAPPRASQAAARPRRTSVG